MIGRVISVKMAKTANVLVEGRKRHSLYGKSFVHSKKYLADDQLGVSLGDIVEITKTRPISKRKHWKITKVLGKDVVALGTEALKEEAAEAIAEVLPEEEEAQAESEVAKEPVESKAKQVKREAKTKKVEATAETSKGKPQPKAGQPVADKKVVKKKKEEK
jgi:small subunit ribosomal protein S17